MSKAQRLALTILVLTWLVACETTPRNVEILTSVPPAPSGSTTQATALPRTPSTAREPTSRIPQFEDLEEATQTGPGLGDIATPIGLPEQVTLPSWVSAGDSNVLLSIGSDETDKFDRIVLINAESGDRFEFAVPGQVWRAGWISGAEGLAVGFERTVYGDRQSTYVYDERLYVESGLTTSVLVSDRPSSRVRELGNGNLVARVSNEDSRVSVLIRNTTTGTEVTLGDPFDGQYPDAIDAEWSKSGAWLAVTRYKYADEPYKRAASGTAIYTRDGSIYRLYDGVSSPIWSMVNESEILYAKSHEYWDQSPCIVDVVGNETTCLGLVDEWREARGVGVNTIRWVPTQNAVSFLYWGSATGGICTVSVDSGNLQCPITKAQIGVNTFVVRYEWSPDGNRLWMEIDEAGPLSDDRTMSQLATISADGSSYKVWGKSYGQEWRP